jgi:hypothetical protein
MKNKNGVKVFYSLTGRYTIPVICSTCKNLDSEIGEYGTILCDFYCIRNLHFPTKKGTCKLYDAKDGRRIIAGIEEAKASTD